jgi:chromosome segregation ATPase
MSVNTTSNKVAETRTTDAIDFKLTLETEVIMELGFENLHLTAEQIVEVLRRQRQNGDKQYDDYVRYLVKEKQKFDKYRETTYKELSEMEDRLCDALGHKESLIDDKDDLAAERNGLLEDKRNLEKEISEQDKKIKLLESSLKSAEKERDTQNRLAKEYCRTVLELGKDIAKKTQLIDQLQSDAKTMDVKLKETVKLTNSNYDALLAYTVENNEMREKCDVLTKQKEQLEEQIMQLHEHVKFLEETKPVPVVKVADMNEIMRQMYDTQIELEKRFKETETVVQTLTTERKDLQRRVDDLQTKHKDTADENRSLVQRNNALTEEVKQLTKEVRDAHCQIDMMDAYRRPPTEECEFYENEFEVLGKSNRMLEDKIYNLEQNSKLLVEKNDKLTENVELLKEKCDKLARAKELLKEKITILKKHNKMLSKTLENYNIDDDDIDDNVEDLSIGKPEN